MIKVKFIHSSCEMSKSFFRLGTLMLLLCFQTALHAQTTFSVSFPIGSTVYRGSIIPLTVVVAGVSCDKTVIKCHQGLVSMVGNCQYSYQCTTTGVDTIEVLIRKEQKIKYIGKQEFVVMEPPIPEAQIAGLKGGLISKSLLQVQQGVSAEFYIAGNHWETCTVESFTVIILRSNNLIATIDNKGALFTNESIAALKELQHDDNVLISNIKACAAQGGNDLKTIEFKID